MRFTVQVEIGLGEAPPRGTMGGSARRRLADALSRAAASCPGLRIIDIVQDVQADRREDAGTFRNRQQRHLPTAVWRAGANG